MPVAGKPMIEWSLEAFRACEAVRAVVVTVPPGRASSASLAASSRRPDDLAGGPGDGSTLEGAEPQLVSVEGGATRAESVTNAIALVETDLVAIHDAARPLVTPELLEAIVSTLDGAPDAAGAIAAAPLTDTVKRAASGTSAAFSVSETENAALVVRETLDRSRLWAAQTPQVFRTAPLREALAAAERPEHATDEAMLLESTGAPVLIHPVTQPNLKVTTPLDLRVAALLLEERSR